MEKLARYRSHKVIRAGQIVGYCPNFSWLLVKLADGSTTTIVPSKDFICRVESNIFKQPVVGDYFTVYSPDDYTSWSPKAVFEDGYTQIPAANEKE